jgi:NAD(P)-dependent dehydrogenase (short-subunit alcohol dehydrogenase family)
MRAGLRPHRQHRLGGRQGRQPQRQRLQRQQGGVIGFTKSLGKELADTGVRVNCVTPAAVKTAIFDQMTPEHIQFMLSKIPMGRFGTPEEIAAMVGWLCTEDCSFSTGAVFDLSGGRATY